MNLHVHIRIMKEPTNENLDGDVSQQINITGGHINQEPPCT